MCGDEGDRRPALVPRMVEHAADGLSKYEGGFRWQGGKGKPCSSEIVESGEKAYDKYSKGPRKKENKLDGEWDKASSWEVSAYMRSVHWDK